MSAKRNTVLIFSLFYLLGLIYLLFFAFFRSGTNTEVNLIPFKNIFSLTVYTFKSGHGIWHWIINVPGNIIAFIPMAIPLSYFVRPRVSMVLFTFLIFLIPIFLELLQYFFQTGSCDVDDVILNVTGIFLGIFLVKKFNR